MTSAYIYLPNSSSSSGGGSVATGSTINGAQIIEANLGATGPYSTSGILNASSATETLIAVRTPYSADGVAMSFNNAANALTVGDNINLSLINLYGQEVNITNYDNAATVYLDTGTIFLDATTISVNGKMSVSTGYSITMQGNGPASTSGQINFSATGTLAAYRNYQNTTDLNILRLDGDNDLTVGDFNSGGNLTLYGGQEVLIGNAPVNGFVLNGSALTLGAGSSTTTIGSASTTVSVSGQQYGAQRVSSAFSTTGTGVATAPSQFIIPFVGGQNVAFDASVFMKGTSFKVAIQAPSGATMNLAACGQVNGGTGFSSDVLSITGGTAVGTGIYAITPGGANLTNVSVQGSISGAAGVVGPALFGFYPNSSVQTCTVQPGSVVWLYPST